MTRNTRRTIAKHGEELCREAFRIHHVEGEGDGTVAAYLNVTRGTANALINAGRDLAGDTHD